MNQSYSYGRILSIGEEVRQEIVGKIAVFDPMGARDLELDPTKDEGLVAIDFSMVFAVTTEEEIKARKLPVP